MGHVSGQKLADIWRYIQGETSWEGSLDPINPILKGEILRYGEHAQLCYEAFEDRDYSQRYGKCKSKKDFLFQESGKLRGCGYEVTRYIKSKSRVLSSYFGDVPTHKATWVGFIAVCTDPNELNRLGRRDIVVAWRGTKTTEEWLQNFKNVLVRATSSQPTECTNIQTISRTDVKIEKGFLGCYTNKEISDLSARDIVVEEIKRLLNQYKNESLSITFTGHSLGGALATLSAYDIKQILNGMSSASSSVIPVTVFAFASPRVGNLKFIQHVEEIGVKVLRVVIKDDWVPKLPGVLVNENRRLLGRKIFKKFPWAYFHVGAKISLQYNSSPYLRSRTLNLRNSHCLDVYLHLMDGYKGSNQPYESSSPGRYMHTA